MQTRVSYSVAFLKYLLETLVTLKACEYHIQKAFCVFIIATWDFVMYGNKGEKIASINWEHVLKDVCIQNIHIS